MGKIFSHFLSMSHKFSSSEDSDETRDRETSSVYLSSGELSPSILSPSVMYQDDDSSLIVIGKFSI